MKSNRLTILEPRWIGASTVLAVMLMANSSWGQLVPEVPAVPDVVPGVTDSAQDAAQDVTNTAQDAVKDSQNTVQDTTQDAAKTIQDAQQDATTTSQGAVKAAKDTAKEAQDTARDATKDAEKTARDAQQDATQATRDASKQAQETARDATDDVRDATQDATRSARDAARDATSDPNVRGNLNARGNVRGQASVGRQGDYRSADLGIWFDRSNTNGLVIADVAANAALSAVGFREGDRIVSINGRNITSEADFVRYLMNNPGRGRMNVIVLRDGQQQTLYLEPGFLNQRLTTMYVEPLEVFGIIPDDRMADRVVVWRVVPRSPAFYAGIRAGDVITAFANRPVTNLQALVQLVTQTRAGTIPLQITRGGRTRTLQADFPDIQTADRHTTFRQNLDADVNVRTNIDADARLGDRQVDGQADVELRGDVNADQNLPAIDTQPQERGRPYYDSGRPLRRGWFRRGR